MSVAPKSFEQMCQASVTIEANTKNNEKLSSHDKAAKHRKASDYVRIFHFLLSNSFLKYIIEKKVMLIKNCEAQARVRQGSARDGP